MMPTMLKQAVSDNEVTLAQASAVPSRTVSSEFRTL